MQSERKWRGGGRGLVDGGSKEEQNIKAERERVRERDEAEGVFMRVREGCESELMEWKR